MTIIRVKETASTNQLLKELVARERLPEGALVVADAQTAGRGQRGAGWEAEPGKNITCSLLLRPDFLPVQQHFLLSEAIALGVLDAIKQIRVNPPQSASSAFHLSVKWPNDIYHNDHKLAGILIENELTAGHITQSVIGIGLNVNQTVFTSDAPNPISLRQIYQQDFDLTVLLENLHQNLMRRYRQLQSGRFDTLRQTYHQALYRRTGLHTYRDPHGDFRAQIQSVGDDGQLHLLTEQGDERSYYFKEVQFSK